MTKQNYVITTKDGNRFTVRATDHTSAADRGAVRLYGKTAITAMRTTGVAGMSGYFQAYGRVKNGALSSHGAPFHVASKGSD